MPFTNLTSQLDGPPQSNPISNFDQVAGKVQQTTQLVEKNALNNLREKLFGKNSVDKKRMKETERHGLAPITKVPQNNVANFNVLTTKTAMLKESLNNSSSSDHLVINSVYSLAETNGHSSSMSSALEVAPKVVLVAPQNQNRLLKSILESPPNSENWSILETNVVKDSFYNLGPPPQYPFLGTYAVKDLFCYNRLPPSMPILETNAEKDSFFNIAPPTQMPILGTNAEKDSFLNIGPPPPMPILETTAEKDSFLNIGPPVPLLETNAEKDSIYDSGSAPPAISSSVENRVPSFEDASCSRAPEPTQTDSGSSLTEVVDVEEEEDGEDDCLVVKIDLSNCQFAIGKRINNLELVIDDSDDEAKSDSTKLNKAQRVQTKKINKKGKLSKKSKELEENSAKISAGNNGKDAGNTSVKTMRKTKPTVVIETDSQTDSFNPSDKSGPENITDKFITNEKSSSCCSEENESFRPRIVKVEDNCDLNETSTEKETSMLTNANEEMPSSGASPHSAIVNQKGNECGDKVTATDAEPIEDGKSVSSGVSAENAKTVSCKACSVTCPTRLDLVNHMYLVHRPKQKQNLLADDSNKIAATVSVDLESVSYSALDEGTPEKLQSVVKPHTATQSNREFHLVHNEHNQNQIIPLNDPGDKSTKKDEHVKSTATDTDSAVTNSADDPVNPATDAAATTNADNGATLPLCVRCECCCEWFSNYSRLMEHLKGEANCKKFQDELFKKQYGILPHSSRSGASGNKPKITCSSCKRKFATKAMLSRHLNDSPKCKKSSKKGGKSTNSKKLSQKSTAEDFKKIISAPESTANTQAVTTKTTTTTSIASTIISENTDIDSLTCTVCKTVFKDEILLAKHLQTSHVCLKPKESQQKKPNFQFRIQLSGYSDNEGTTKKTKDQVQELQNEALHKPTEQREKNLESNKTKSPGQQVAPVTSIKPVLHQGPKAIQSQPHQKTVEHVQMKVKETSFSTNAPGKQVAPVTSINPVLYQWPGVIQSQPPEERMQPVQLSSATDAPGKQVAPVTSINPVLYQGPGVIHSQPLEERAQPVQNKAKETSGTTALFSDTDSCDSSQEENSADSSSSNEDAVVEYKCKHCSNTYTHKSDFKKHLKSHMKDSVGHTVTKINCKVCKKKFKDNTGLQAHLLQRRICFLHVTRAYRDGFEKGTNICQMCKKSLPSTLDFSKHFDKSLTCRLRYIDLVLQNIKKTEGGSLSLASSNVSGSLCETKSDTQASSSLNENSCIPGGVLAVVSSTMDKALLPNNINIGSTSSGMQEKLDLAIQSSSAGVAATSSHSSHVQHRANVSSTSSPNTSQGRRCHCCNAAYDKFVDHIISSKQCLIYYEMHPEIQPASSSICFKCRRRFKNNLECKKHSCYIHKYECFECGLRYIDQKAIKSHYKKMHPGLKVNAQLQQLLSNSTITVSESNSKETFSLTASPFNCLICHAQFQTLLLLMEHSYIHTDEIPFVCSRCNTTFHHYNRYVSHQAYHMRMDKDFAPLNQDSVLVNSIVNNASPILPASGTPHLKTETGETARDSAEKLATNESKKKYYKCYVCLKSFSEFETYKIHILLHAQVSYISCTVCFENFPSEKALQEHNKQHEMSRTSKKNNRINSPSLLKQNEKKTNCTCLFCHLVFTGQKNKLDHLGQSVSCKSIMSYMLEKQFFVHPSTNQKIPFNPNQCVFCDEHFPDVISHIIQTSCLILFEAGVIKYRSDATLQNDNNSEQCDDFVCETCSKRFQKQSSLDFHKLSVHKISPMKKPADSSDLAAEYPEDDHLYCFRCKKFFETPASVIEHNKSSHRLMSRKVLDHMVEKNGDALCTYCNISFPVEYNRRTLILSHMFKMHNEGSSKLLDFHAKVDAPVVDISSKLKYYCSICGAVMASSAKSSHVQVHIKNYISQLAGKSSKAMTAFSVEKCPICKHILHSRKTMRLHLMRHETQSIIRPLSEQKSAGNTNLKLCACPECKRWFKSEYSLNFHIKKCHRNSGEKRFRLPIKNVITKKTTSSSSDITQRKDVKTAKKTSSSDITQRKEDVKAMDIVHTQGDGLSTYICKLCTKRFTSLSSFRSHLNKSHKILNLKNVSDFLENIETSESSVKDEYEALLTTPDNKKIDLIRTECLPGFSLRLTTSTSINCHICKVSIVVQDYQYHLRSVHSFSADQLFECPHCSLKFPYQNLLNDHQYQCQLDCKCLICDKQTISIRGFKSHLSQRHEVSLSSYTNAHFPCELIKVVNDGLRIMTAETSGSKRVCLACHEMFTEQYVYRKHIESHVKKCSVYIEDYFLMVQTETDLQSDSVLMDAGLQNRDDVGLVNHDDVELQNHDDVGFENHVDIGLENHDDVELVNRDDVGLENRDDVGLENHDDVGHVNFDADSASKLEEVKIEMVDCADVQTTGAMSNVSANIDNDVAVIDENNYELLDILCSTGARVDSSTNVLETVDTPNVQTTEVHNEHITLPVKMEDVSCIDLCSSESDSSDFENSADSIVCASDKVHALGVLEPRLPRKRSSSTELVNEPKRRKSDDTVNTLSENDLEIESQITEDNFMQSSDPSESDSDPERVKSDVTVNTLKENEHAVQSQITEDNSMQSSDPSDTDPERMKSDTVNTLIENEHTTESQMPEDNSMQSSDPSDTDPERMKSDTVNTLIEYEHTTESQMPEDNSMQSSDPSETDPERMKSDTANTLIENEHMTESQTPEDNSMQSSLPSDTDRNVFSAFQENFRF